MFKKYSHILKFQVVILLISISSCSQNELTPPPPDVGFVPESSVEVIPFDDLLELVQETTFKYFWDFAEPNSGLARERSQENAIGPETRNIVTTGGSGFGIACFPIAVERGWIRRAEAIERMNKILSFLEKINTYHGAFAHWYNGSSEMTVPFSALDDGGDIVETSLLLQGLLIAKQYFDLPNTEEESIRDRITQIYANVEWTWYTQGGEKVLTWHWSPNNGFAINLKINGWNEALIVYVLAAGSSTFPIDKETYDNGWAENGGMRNGNNYLGYQLPLGEPFGGPLFLSQYSFIGINPTNLSDNYTSSYFQQNRIHTLINYEYCKNNPNDYIGYSENNWGLTASDNYNGYSAHSPTNDLGVITPTAALSAFPYTPEESRKALEYFYYQKNDLLWGEYGFFDAFSEEFNWYADGYLAIDQGPIIAMIENSRTQQLWNLFMKDPNVIDGLTKLGFTF